MQKRMQFASIADAMAAIAAAADLRTPGPKRSDIVTSTRVDANKKRGKRKQEKKIRNIAILDFETDPFDNRSDDRILPFLAVLWREGVEPVIIWEEDEDLFAEAVISAIHRLPDAFTVYAHNGGKFDFMFLVSRLRGAVSFKGRGIMEARVGAHILRDSYHIIPERLASLNKMPFDYADMAKGRRDKFRKEIIDYCISDCENLHFYVRRFLERYGFKMSIGGASLAQLRQFYEIGSVSETTDEYLRRFYFGGRVECIAGLSRHKNKKLFDINSAYPDAMARLKHPVGSEYIKRTGEPSDATCFLTLTCDNNGALMARGTDGSVSTAQKSGTFHTTIYEYKMALKLGLISNVKIIEVVDNLIWTDFADFVVPIYDHRAAEKANLKVLEKGSRAWNECNVEVVFDKLIMNNAYGKTAQNPRTFKEYYLTDPGEFPPRDTMKQGEEGFETEYMGATYWIWSRPAPTWRFLNVGTGASITGAVRAKLMEALFNAVNPVYCDTDSIICDDLPNTELDALKLGAWDLEKEIEEIIICGKKLYAYKTTDGGDTVKSKGAAGLTWDDMETIFSGGTVQSVNKGVTMTRTGSQIYLRRDISATTAKAIT